MRHRIPPEAVAPPAPTMLREAMRAHQAGDLETAERLYLKVLELQVAQPDALHYLGVLRHQRGHSDDAVELIEAALRITPRHPDAHNNLGNVHKECGRLAEAEACYRHALACSPGRADVLCNLGVTFSAQGRIDEALATYAELTRLAPGYAYGHYLRGLLLRERAASKEDLEQSVECLRRASQIDPRDAKAREALGISLYALGRRGDARQLYAGWLQREPDNPLPRHMLAACGGSPPPPRADDAYVRDVFDEFADSFDEQLVENLDYRAPRVLVGALCPALPALGPAMDVLDAGCGTGLCGPLLRPYARRLVGVDLSPRMVERARTRGSYDVLEVAELTAYLQARLHAWDIVISADTLVYFGDLHVVLSAAYAALRPGGWVAFSLEAREGDEDVVELTASGRYRHSRAHIMHALERAGFGDIRIGADSLRKELGQPVPGWVVLAQ